MREDERQRENEADPATGFPLLLRERKRKKRERVDEVTGNPSIYMTAVCLGRLLMGERREEGRL